MRFPLAIGLLILFATLAAAQQAPRRAPGQRVERVNFQGARRVPEDTLRALVATKPGDVYSEDTVKRDFDKLWNTNRFEDVRVQVGVGRTGVVVTFVLTERAAQRGNQPPDKSVPVAELLDRFKR
jgi:outer membrane protein insertion porin family